MRKILFIIAVLVCGCQTQRQKDLSLVRDRYLKLKPLSSYSSTVCEIESRPTQPALARFQQMSKEKVNADSWKFTWRQTETRCEIKPHDKNSKIAAAQIAFLETGFCLLLQSHYVNSPFDELPVKADDIKSVEGVVQVGPAISLARDEFLISTKTKAHGDLRARYRFEESLNQWVPWEIEQRTDQFILSLTDLVYGSPQVGNRFSVKSATLSVGTERLIKHSDLQVMDCRPM